MGTKELSGGVSTGTESADNAKEEERDKYIEEMMSEARLLEKILLTFLAITSVAVIGIGILK